MGLDVSKPDDLAWLHDQIVETGANFVVKDSRRRMTPSKAENQSDDMAATIPCGAVRGDAAPFEVEDLTEFPGR